MKKFSILLLFLACALTGQVQASDYVDANEDCSLSSCYECSCNPLYCGAWDLQVQGGVNPIVWRHRDINAPTLPNLFAEIPRFSKLFKTPWIIGGQVGYAWSDNVRVYGEFNYSQAKSKNNSALAASLSLGEPDPIVINNAFLFKFHKYKLFDAYFGARYYWDRWCDRVAFFLGAQVGLTSHRKTEADFPTPTDNFPFTEIEWFRRSIVVSGGANFGFDVCFCENWSFVLTGEVIASCGPRSGSIISTDQTPFANLIVGPVETELRFPVTAAIRYSF